MRRARHLPGPDPAGVGLLGRRVPELDQIGLGLEHEHRHVEVGTDPQVTRDPGGVEVPLSGAPLPPRLWMKIPSKAWVTGWRASAKVVR